MLKVFQLAANPSEALGTSPGNGRFVLSTAHNLRVPPLITLKRAHAICLDEQLSTLISLLIAGAVDPITGVEGGQHEMSLHHCNRSRLLQTRVNSITTS
jgi:hypothetical protein